MNSEYFTSEYNYSVFKTKAKIYGICCVPKLIKRELLAFSIPLSISYYYFVLLMFFITEDNK